MPQAQSTPRRNIAEQSFQIENLYKIIKTEDGQVVLHHDTANASLLRTAQEDNPTIRRFTLHNPVIPDDIFMSPPREYEEMVNWLYSPNDGTISPVSSDHSSIGYFSGSDWSTDSSWMSYNSLVQSVFNPPISSPFRPISPLPPIVDVPQENRGLSQPQQSCENLDTRGTPKGGNEEIDKEKKRKKHHHEPKIKQPLILRDNYVNIQLSITPLCSI